MDEYFFGVRDGKLSVRERKRREAAARKHGARFVYLRDGDGERSWFACRNLGEPFDGATARAVLAELELTT